VSQADDRHTTAEKKGWGPFSRLFGRKTDSHADAKITLDLSDIQGFILRGYRMPMVRHFLLTVSAPAEARKLLGRFVSGNETDAPQITTAEDWHVGFERGLQDNPNDVPRRKPDYCLNVGITWPGRREGRQQIVEPTPTSSFLAIFLSANIDKTRCILCDLGKLSNFGSPSNNSKSIFLTISATIASNFTSMTHLLCCPQHCG
jgi:hypothetical protein